MSRTHHHSYRWAKSHAWAIRPDRRGYNTTPSWHVTMFMHRPGRQEDRLKIIKILHGVIDPDEAVFTRTGNRKPHEYYW